MLQSVSKYLFITLLASGCSYRQGEPQTGIWDTPIHLDILSNETLYPELTQKLRRQLIEAIKAEQGPKLGQKENGASPLGGKLLNVDKAVLEQDSFGHPTELQLTLSFSLTWKGKTGTVHNTDLRHSSGLFRPYDARLRPNDAARALSEREALDEAIKDLAQVILLEIRRHTKS